MSGLSCLPGALGILAVITREEGAVLRASGSSRVLVLQRLDYAVQALGNWRKLGFCHLKSQLSDTGS